MKQPSPLLRASIAICGIFIGLLYFSVSTQAQVDDTVLGNSRGYLTTPQELRLIKQKADQNIEPYKGAVNALLSYVKDPAYWPYGNVDPTDRDTLHHASALVYAKAIAYHLTGNNAYADSAREKILAISTQNTCSDTYSGGNGCILTLSRHTGNYVFAADLLEDYPGWSQQDKQLFQEWLRTKVYKFTDWASDERSTNWGAIGSSTTAIIADYFANSELPLIDRNGQIVTAEQAYENARIKQLDRMNGTQSGDGIMINSVCPAPMDKANGIQSYGGIPEETGRGSTGCTGTYLLDCTDPSWSYMHTHLSGTVMQAELHLRRGDHTLFDNLASTGKGSILKAIHYVIQNPNKPDGQCNWLDGRKSILEIAYRYYRDNAMAQQLGIGTSNRHIAGDKNSAAPHFGTLTHGFSSSESPELPPTVPPPGTPSSILPTITPSSSPTSTSTPSTPAPTASPSDRAKKIPPGQAKKAGLLYRLHEIVSHLRF